MIRRDTSVSRLFSTFSDTAAHDEKVKILDTFLQKGYTNPIEKLIFFSKNMKKEC